MSVIALFEFKALPGRLKEFESKPMQAKSPRNGSEKSNSIRVFRRAIPGPNTRGVIVAVEYDNLAKYGERTPLQDLLLGSQDNLLSVDLFMQIPA